MNYDIRERPSRCQFSSWLLDYSDKSGLRRKTIMRCTNEENFPRTLTLRFRDVVLGTVISRPFASQADALVEYGKWHLARHHAQ